ncbi:polyhydroxybutyrate depolymerase [Paraneptunicella aestuarii]|uniref:extracellular catalytic domain type 2 short-chain-length polyhydroxyalkanoate depolymerase n=1 Tax=Paraneptunicella aestuarii TaxID=2831148 RepID=UPI001E632D09|nr:PHB depolymerase family esterase [Paraneptunicella aestuarii]UAA37916.1 polyhydroxybutyrate depolymerase [Paraneptunicella aestuarii]
MSLHSGSSGKKSVKQKLFHFSLFASAIAISFSSYSEPLALNLDLSKTTVSGLSSGGYMATQFHLAHSELVQGAAMIASGPYFCAQNSLTTALSQCVGKSGASIELNALETQIDRWQQEGKIADTKSLQDDKIWILGGTLDQKVGRSVVSALNQQYQQWIPKDNIQYVQDKAFAHHFPTANEGSDCKKSESPYIGNCQFDAAGSLLTQLYGNLTPATQASQSHIHTISTEQLPKEQQDTLATESYLYVPENCAEGKACSLHISFHGCNQNAEAIGTDYVTKTGLNRWAESNNIVVLYPQTKNSTVLPFNPQGCWDWWGYTDGDYATRNGKQIKAVYSLIQQISGRQNG